MCGLMSPRAMPVNLKQDVQAGAGPLALAVMAGVLAGMSTWRFRRQGAPEPATLLPVDREFGNPGGPAALLTAPRVAPPVHTFPLLTRMRYR